jgi:hypothetical protein
MSGAEIDADNCSLIIFLNEIFREGDGDEN